MMIGHTLAAQAPTTTMAMTTMAATKIDYNDNNADGDKNDDDNEDREQ